MATDILNTIDLQINRRVRRQTQGTLTKEQIIELLEHAGKPVQQASNLAEVSEIKERVEQCNQRIDELNTHIKQFSDVLEHMKRELAVLNQRCELLDSEQRKTNGTVTTGLKKIMDSIPARKSRPDNLRT